MEILNAVLVPAFMVACALYFGSKIGWLAAFAFIPMCAMLVIGGLYWRAKLFSLQGDRPALERFLRFADRRQAIVAVFTVVAIALALFSWVWPPPSVSLSDRVVGSSAALLAGLEYVNYYHRQLQHFDHKADFRRLLNGKGFRKAQMAVDLAAFRRRKR